MTDDACEYISERSNLSPEEARDFLASENADGRLLTTEEVADAIFWMANQNDELENGAFHIFDGQSA